VYVVVVPAVCLSLPHSTKEHVTDDLKDEGNADVDNNGE